VRYIGIKKSENSINIFLEYVPGKKRKKEKELKK